MGHKGSTKRWTSTIKCAGCGETFNISLAELSLEKRNDKEVVTTSCPNCERDLVVHKLPEDVINYLRVSLG